MNLAVEKEIEEHMIDCSYSETEKVKRVTAKQKPVYSFIKRCFDVVFAVIIGAVLIIPMTIIGIIIKLDSPGPVLFTHERMGQNGKTFRMYKFRSMTCDAPPDRASRKFADSDRYITRVGAFLRRTSLDELPQLINILKGEMSFVGYRPLCLTEKDVNELRMERGILSVRPGLTGLAQVCGRDELEPEEKVCLDAEYVSRRSFGMDLYWLWKTVAVVLSGKGVN